MSGRYTIWLDGLAYCGEADESEEQPPQTGGWWLQNPVSRRSRIAIGTGDPKIIESARNLASHIERIVARHREGALAFSELVIRAEQCKEPSVVFQSGDAATLNALADGTGELTLDDRVALRAIATRIDTPK